MSVTTLSVTMNSENELFCADEGGFSGEHNAQMLEITLSEEFASAAYDYINIAFDTGGIFGKSVSNEIRGADDAPVYRIDNKIYCTLVQSLTSSGVLRFQLSAHSENEGIVTETKKSGILELAFKPSIPDSMLPTDVEATVVSRIGAALNAAQRLKEQLEALASSQISAGSYLTLTDGVMSANVADSVNTPGEKIPSCAAVEEYCANLTINGLALHNSALCASLTARLINSMDENCLGVFINHGLVVGVNAVQSGLIEMMIYSENMQGKYILIVPLSDVSDMTLFATAQDYFEGSIYKVSGDTVNLTEMVTRIAEGGFAQLLGLSV